MRVLGYNYHPSDGVIIIRWSNKHSVFPSVAFAAISYVNNIKTDQIYVCLFQFIKCNGMKNISMRFIPVNVVIENM